MGNERILSGVRNAKFTWCLMEPTTLRKIMELIAIILMIMSSLIVAICNSPLSNRI